MGSPLSTNLKSEEKPALQGKFKVTVLFLTVVMSYSHMANLKSLVSTELGRLSVLEEG